MNEKQLKSFQSEECGGAGYCPTSDTGSSAGRKPAFVKPELICRGAVADLTSSFGGSITPNYRSNPLHPNPFQQKD
jgi:hypothetical protein